MRVTAMTRNNDKRTPREKPVINRILPAILTDKVDTKPEESFINLYACVPIQIKAASVFLEGDMPAQLTVEIGAVSITVNIVPGRNDISTEKGTIIGKDEKMQIFCNREVTLWYSIIYVVK